MQLDGVMSIASLPNRAFSACLAVLLGAFTGSVAAQSEVLSTTVQTQTQMNQQAQQTQRRINQLAEETDELLGEYRRVIRETESLRVYNQQLERIVANQREELSGAERTLEQLETTNRGIVPLIIEMIDTLDKLVEADVPFRINERRQRVTELKDIIDRADVTTSEKYRRVMEAYQIEMEYGRTTESYQAELADTGRNVDFLRVGRTLLIWQSLDGQSQGWFNPNTRSWEPLDNSHRSAIRDGLRIAKNQAAPNLVVLPVPAPVKP
jgi:chromosome segregation ATPase